jgi:predicted nucleic acid-binding protein
VNVVNSSGWIEYFANAPGADFFAPVLENVNELLVPQICMAEVARYFHREQGIRQALHALAQMEEGRVIRMNVLIMTRASRLAKDYRLPLADSLVLATARAYEAVVWTQDSDFKGIEGVMYTPKVK